MRDETGSADVNALLELKPTDSVATLEFVAVSLLGYNSRGFGCCDDRPAQNAGKDLSLDHVAESLLAAVLAENEIPKQQMRQNIYQQIVAHESLVRNAVTTPEAQEKAMEEFRARFRACLDHEASKANPKTASHLREVAKIFAGDRP